MRLKTLLESSYVPKRAFNIRYLDQNQKRGRLKLLAKKSEEEEGEREDVVHSAFFIDVTKVS